MIGDTLFKRYGIKVIDKRYVTLPTEPNSDHTREEIHRQKNTTMFYLLEINHYDLLNLEYHANSITQVRDTNVQLGQFIQQKNEEIDNLKEFVEMFTEFLVANPEIEQKLHEFQVYREIS